MKFLWRSLKPKKHSVIRLLWQLKHISFLAIFVWDHWSQRKSTKYWRLKVMWGLLSSQAAIPIHFPSSPPLPHPLPYPYIPNYLLEFHWLFHNKYILKNMWYMKRKKFPQSKSENNQRQRSNLHRLGNNLWTNSTLHFKFWT